MKGKRKKTAGGLGTIVFESKEWANKCVLVTLESKQWPGTENKDTAMGNGFRHKER